MLTYNSERSKQNKLFNYAFYPFPGMVRHQNAAGPYPDICRSGLECPSLQTFGISKPHGFGEFQNCCFERGMKSYRQKVLVSMWRIEISTFCL